MAKVKITQVKSIIDRSKRQKDTMRSLGFRKMNHTVEHNATPQILGHDSKSSASYQGWNKFKNGQ